MRLLLPALLALAALPCGAQQYPAKPIRMIVPVAAGGSTDNNGRLLAEKLTQGLGQSVFVENRPGASTDIGMGMLARAAPDGYTLAAVPMPSISTGILARKLPYDPYKDIVPVAGFSRGALVFVVSGASPYQSMAELIAGARAKPGALSFGSIGVGSTHHLAGELLKLMAGVDLLHVPYKGASESNTAVLAGQIEASVSGGSSIAALVRAGKLRALAVTEGTRVPSLPDVPSVAETVPGYAAGSGTLTLFAPGGIPPAIVARLSAEVARAVKDPEVIKRIAAAGEYPAPSTPEELATELRSGIEKWTHLVKVTGLKLQ